MKLSLKHKKQWALRLGALALCVTSVYYAGRENIQRVNSGKAGAVKKRPCVVIDAGHGGFDPGKVGINGVLEKDVNLEIAGMVKEFLEKDDIEVVMTRESDIGLYKESDSNKKVQDMKNRIGIIEETKPVVTVSIHQNSYHEEYVHGAQVFYYTGSVEGKELAGFLQRRLVEDIDPSNTRVEKANDSYYLLKKTSSPIVIVECGFLSNRQEADALSSQYYQEKMAWAIHLGIIQYINDRVL